MPSLTSSDGARLVYEIEGTGPPLLLHLGAGCDADLWRAAGYVAPLSKSYTCILFDHRGHGRSDHPLGGQANHIDRYAADVCTLLDELGLESSAFWGYSNGITVGLKVADDHPARIRCLVGSGTISNPTPEELAERIPGRIAEHREYRWEKLIAGFEEDEGTVPAWMKERIRATDIEPYIGWFESRLSWNWEPWAALSRLQVPVLFVVGELEDPEDTMAEGVAQSSRGSLVRVPGSLVRVPGKGHISAFLDSGFVLPHVQKFLAGYAGQK
jgi:pimeloyl-ACP methyl ester carboxylesterase